MATIIVPALEQGASAREELKVLIVYGIRRGDRRQNRFRLLGIPRCSRYFASQREIRLPPRRPRWKPSCFHQQGSCRMLLNRLCGSRSNR